MGLKFWISTVLRIIADALDDSIPTIRHVQTHSKRIVTTSPPPVSPSPSLSLTALHWILSFRGYRLRSLKVMTVRACAKLWSTAAVTCFIGSQNRIVTLTTMFTKRWRNPKGKRVRWLGTDVANSLWSSEGHLCTDFWSSSVQNCRLSINHLMLRWESFLSGGRPPRLRYAIYYQGRVR